VDQPNSSKSSRSTRAGAAVIAVIGLIAAGVIIAGVVIGSGGGSPAATAGANTQFKAAPPTRTAGTHSEPALPAGHGALVASVTHSTTLRAAPSGHAIARLTKHTEFDSPEVLWVIRRSGSWLGVVSTLAGNGRVGWIPRSAAALTRVPWEIHVSLSARRVTVIDAGKVVKRYTVAIGAPASPTPTGRFAVTDRLTTGDPNGPYGCCILALSARSPHAIQGWAGGDRIAIHSTPETSSIGRAASHGCMRLTLAEGRWLLDHVPLGTPTIIRT
jgi:lipoprotein-anchoring transpeptidase ErfK/SrfK